MSTKQCINYQLRIDQVLQSISIAFPQELHLKVSGEFLLASIEYFPDIMKGTSCVEPIKNI